MNELPQRLEDGTYTPGIGHTGQPWPRGTGHDYCWDPGHCISCGCSDRGPCMAHLNRAIASGWRPTPEEGDLKDLIQKRQQWERDMAELSARVERQLPSRWYG